MPKNKTTRNRPDSFVARPKTSRVPSRSTASPLDAARAAFSTAVSSKPGTWISQIAPDIRRIGLGRWFSRWFLAISAAICHVWGLTWLSAHTGSPWLFYAAVLTPAVITAVLRPKASLFRWYRWVAVYALVLSSAAGTTVLIGAEAWALAAFFAPAAAAVTSSGPVSKALHGKAQTRQALRADAAKKKASSSAIPLTGMWKLSQAVAGKVVRFGGSR